MKDEKNLDEMYKDVAAYLLKSIDRYEAIGKLIDDKKLNRGDYQLSCSIITLGQVKHLNKNAFDQARTLIDFVSDNYEELFGKKKVFK